MTMPDTILASMLAREFAAELRGSFDARQMAIINERNAHGSPSCCASHDFCDANMVMAAAALRLLGHDLSDEAKDPAQFDIDLALWNAAWGIAKSRRFWGDPQEAEFIEWQATREACADLGQQMDDEILQGVPGLIYEGGYIEMRHMPLSLGHYQLTIERSEWDSDDLEALERILFFEWVLPNGFLADQRDEDHAPGVSR